MTIEDVTTPHRNYDKMDHWFSKMRALAFTYFLSGSIRAAAIQFTQNFVTGIPFLAREMKDMGWLGAERAYTFRRFTHNYMLSIVYSFRMPDEKFNLKNMDIFLRSLAWMAVFGGLSGLPFVDDLLDQLEKFFGIPFRTKIRSFMKAMGGEPLERAGISGIPALIGQVPGMVGVNLSGSIRVGLPNFTEPLKGGEETVFGVWGGMGKKMANAWQSASREDYLRAVEFASPAFVENILKAARMATQGATTPTGKVLFDEKGKPIRENIGEAIVQGLGFRPERIAGQAKSHQEYTNIQGNFSERRGDLYAKAKLTMGKPEDLRGVITAIQKYNLDAANYRGAIPLINGAALRRAMAAKPEKKFMLYENIFGQTEANPWVGNALRIKLHI